MKILNIVIFYNNREEVEAYISEVASISGGMVDIALVVNSEKGSQFCDMDANLRNICVGSYEVFDYGENVGYLNAMLKTIRQIDISQYEYIILSNTDIHYETLGFFQKLTSNHYPKNVGCIAPSVYATQSGSYSNPHYMERISKKKLERNVRIFSHPMLAKYYLKLASIKAGKACTEKQSSCYVYSPHGCYMIFTSAFIQKILGYEYGVKLYSEESAVGELLLRNNMKCYYDDSISVIHQESTVTGSIDYKKRFNAWRESLEYILNEFY